MKQIPWPDGWNVAQLTMYQAPKNGEFAPNIIVQLRTDAGEDELDRLAQRDIESLRDSGTTLHTFERNAENDLVVQEYEYDGTGGERLWQSVTYLQGTNGVFSVTATDAADGPAIESARKTAQNLVSVLKNANA